MSNSESRRALTVILVMASTLMPACATKPTPSLQLPLTDTPVSAATPVTTLTRVTERTTTPSLASPTLVPVTSTVMVAAAAMVNGQAILLEDYEAEISQALAVLSEQMNFDPNTEEGKAALLQLRHQILDAMIDQELIEQAAAREGITISDEQVDEEMARLIGEDASQFSEWLDTNGLTREAFKAQLARQLLSAAVQEHVLGSTTPVVEQVHARHILVPTEEDAMGLLLQLRSGGSFSELAQAHSQDGASSELGGDLGFFPRGVMPIGIEGAAFGLSPGQISGIVKTSFGYHIIEVVEKDPARDVPEEMVSTWRQNTFLGWLEAHRAAAKVKYLIPLDQ